MRFAVIGDIHSNIYALENVMGDIRAKDVDFILCTGDLVGYAPFPNEVIEFIRNNNILSIQGNYDKAIGNAELVCGCDYKDQKQLETAGLSVMFTNETITEKNREYLRNLPEQLRIRVSDLRVLLVHGSPRKINEYLFADQPAVEAVTKEMQEDVLICGHTHKPYFKGINGKYVLNAGSVGKPKHGNPNATYIIVSIEEQQVNAEIREVSYDYEKTARAIEENEILPNEFAELLRKG